MTSNADFGKDFEIAGRRVQPALLRIVADDQSVTVEPKVMGVLLALAEQPGEVLSRSDLIDRVWGTEAISDDVLTRAVVELRKLFGDSPSDPRVIATIRGRGYRLIAEIGRGESGIGQSVANQVEPSTNSKREQAAALGPSLPVSSKAAISGTATPSPTRNGRWLVAAALLLTAAGVMGFLRFRPVADSPGALSSGAGAANSEGPVRVSALTGSPHRDRDPAVSPDGTHIAYSLDDPAAADLDLYLKLIDAGAPLRLTEGGGDDRHPTFSPDGTHIAFVRITKDDCAISLIAATGGAVRRLSPCVPGFELRMAWSPDGNSLAVSEAMPGEARRVGLSLLDLDTLERRRLTEPPQHAADVEPAFSPDGKFLAFARHRDRGSELFVVPVSGGPPRQMTFDQRGIAGQSWSHDGQIVFSSERAGTYSLWRQATDGDEPRWLLGGGNNIKHPSHAQKAAVLAYEQWQYEVNIWRVPLLPDEAVPSQAIIASTQRDFAPVASPNGDRLAFVSNRSGSYEIWLANSDGEAARQVTRLDLGSMGTPAWSPDGRRLAFVATADGASDLYISGVDDVVATRLSFDAARESKPSWSQDGRWIYYTAESEGVSEVWRRSSDGDEVLQVTDGGASLGRESADGQQLYFQRADESGLWRQELSSGNVEKVVADLQVGSRGDWATARDGIYFVDRSTRQPMLHHLSWSGAQRQIAPFPDADRVGFSISPDGQWIYLARVDRAMCHIMVARNLR